MKSRSKTPVLRYGKLANKKILEQRIQKNNTDLEKNEAKIEMEKAEYEWHELGLVPFMSNVKDLNSIEKKTIDKEAMTKIVNREREME